MPDETPSVLGENIYAAARADMEFRTRLLMTASFKLPVLTLIQTLLRGTVPSG